jgi:hypothetical protein
MSKPADFMVVLRSDIAESDLELLGPVVHTLRLKSGQDAHVLWCKTVASADGSYLHAEAKLVAGDTFSPVRLPHSLVLIITGAKNAPPIGFVWEAESQLRQ